ncbi:MAG: cytochrome c [Inquilinus sp.]|nr:cytochrome c [Inquilinus sp.]
MASGAAAAEISAARESELKTLLLHDCGACHGMTLRGGLGPPLEPARIAWQSEEVLAAVILDGVPGTPMPPWRFEIAPEEAVWLARLLKQGLPDES